MTIQSKAGVVATIALALAAMAFLGSIWWPHLSHANVPASDSQALKGRWLRPDGGYVLEVKAVADNGVMDAAYFNPNPIHVATARASQTNGATQVFIELRDVNYPGSTYTLTYDPKEDRLKGLYFHAVLQQNFDVYFVRLKP
jgi:uncharacterized lipoprotein YddW (UPF0748 family)